MVYMHILYMYMPSGVYVVICIFKKDFAYLLETEKESTSEVGKQQRKREKQTGSLTRDYTPGLWDHDLS